MVNNKAVLFYIHRLGSEHPSAAEWSSRKLKDRVRTSLEHAATSSAHLNALRNCPFLIQLPTITSATIFWTETLHKERLSMWKKEEEGTKDLSTVDTSKLHDILRYVHSYMANLQIVLETLNFVKAEHEWYLQNLDNTNHYRESPWSSTMRDGIEAQVFQIKVIIIWTTEVLKRTRILIDLVSRLSKTFCVSTDPPKYFNRMSMINSRTHGRIAEETQKDAISMRTIAFVTMFFLPTTSVASFFDLSFLSEGIFTQVRYVWIYFLVAIAMTTVVISLWYWWLQRRMNRVRRNEVDEFFRATTKDKS